MLLNGLFLFEPFNIELFLFVLVQISKKRPIEVNQLATIDENYLIIVTSSYILLATTVHKL